MPQSCRPGKRQAAPRVARASGGGKCRLYLRARTTCASCGDVNPSSDTLANAALISRATFLSNAFRCTLAIRSTKLAKGVADNWKRTYCCAESNRIIWITCSITRGRDRAAEVIGVSPDSPLEGDGFELPVPPGIGGSPSWWSRTRKPHGGPERSFIDGGLIVRIHLPPATSRTNLIIPSDLGAAQFGSVRRRLAAIRVDRRADDRPAETSTRAPGVKNVRM
jgi:hypothetical protein